jgi:hypothetical protein
MQVIDTEVLITTYTKKYDLLLQAPSSQLQDLELCGRRSLNRDEHGSVQMPK